MASINRYETKTGTRYRVRYTTPEGQYTDKRGFRTKRDAERWQAENLLAMSRGQFVSEESKRMPMRGLLDQYVSRRGHLAESTRASRRSTAACWVAPYWDDVRLGDVTPNNVHEWVEWMRGEGASETTVEKAFRVLAGVLNLAVDSRLIHDSPMPRLKLRRAVQRKRPVLTLAQLSDLREAIDPRYRTLLGVLAFTGIRFGEAAALRVSSVRVADRRLDIRMSATEVGGIIIEDATKSGRARAVPLPEFLLGGLTDLVDGRDGNELLFTSPSGSQLRLGLWRSRTFYPALERAMSSSKERGDAEFPRITPHDLRHTAASLAVQAGANVLVLQRMLGHKSAAMTLDVYSDLYDEDLTEISDRMSACVGLTESDGWTAYLERGEALRTKA